MYDRHDPEYSSVHEQQHTLGHIDCEACREASRAAMLTTSLASLPFLQAANLWLDSRKNIDTTTRFNYQCYIKSLARFFGLLTLAQVEIGHVQTYQSQRSKGEIVGLRKAGSSCVNHELNTLQQMMTRAGEWTRIADWYEPLPQKRSTVGCALTDEQESRLFRVAASRKRWHVAYCCSMITANTTAGPGEIRRLQLQDVDFQRRTIYIRLGAKNSSRIRRIPLNDDALWAVTELWKRAELMGACLPQHYLLPHRAANRAEKADPNRPMGSWRKAWEALREAAGMPKLRRYDLRHHAITKLLENPNIPERAVIDLAGHVSNQMLDTYSHTRQQALHDAVTKIDTGLTKKIHPHVIEISHHKVAPLNEDKCINTPNSHGNSLPPLSATYLAYRPSTASSSDAYPLKLPQSGTD